jgi:hypothetical protein
VVLAAFRESAYDAPDLAWIAQHIELSLGHQVPADTFVTAVMAAIDPDGAQIRLLNCGHPPPLLLLSGRRARLAEPLEAGLPLGMAHLAAGERKEHTVAFGPGDRMLFYTDGISEARDRSGAFYPVDRSGRCSPSQTRTPRSTGSTTMSCATPGVDWTTTPPHCSSRASCRHHREPVDRDRQMRGPLPARDAAGLGQGPPPRPRPRPYRADGAMRRFSPSPTW